MSWMLKKIGSRAGWVKLGLLILAGLIMATAGRAQSTFPFALGADGRLRFLCL